MSSGYVLEFGDKKICIISGIIDDLSLVGMMARKCDTVFFLGNEPFGGTASIISGSEEDSILGDISNCRIIIAGIDDEIYFNYNKIPKGMEMAIPYVQYVFEG